MMRKTAQPYIRALVASVMALVFAFQLSFLQTAQVRVSSGGSAAVSQSVAKQDAAPTCHDDGAPAQNEKSPCSHCDHCTNGSRNDSAAITIPAREFVSIGFATTRADPAGWLIFPPLEPKPPGWASTWASRAPPSFS